jgi:hypothetical protein
MPSPPDWIAVRGEWVSLLLVAAALALSVRPLTRLLGLPREALGDLFWYGGIVFVAAGRLAYVALESPDALTDPLVLIRISGGIEPFAGLLAALAVVGWRTRGKRAHSEARAAWLAAAAAALVLATATYDLACVARDACYGAAAPAPLGFAMSDLSDTRLATPLIEASLLLLAAGALLSAPLAPRRALLALGGLAALLRVALTPLSVLGTGALGLETMLFAALGIALLASSERITWGERQSTTRAGPSAPR